MPESSGFNTYGEYSLLEHSLDILPTNELSSFQAAGAVQPGQRRPTAAIIGPLKDYLYVCWEVRTLGNGFSASAM